MKKRDPLLVNKIAAAFLSGVLFVMLLSSAVDLLTPSNALNADVYQVASIEVAAADANKATGNDQQEEIFNATEFFAAAKVKSGKRVVKKCLACHSFDNGGANKVGPNLYNLINRDIGNSEGFAYSAAMKEYQAEKKQWTLHNLVKFLTKPKVEVKGTSMGFAGLKKKDIANLLAYINENYADQAIDLKQ